jgi:hypothetical protein
LYYNNYQPWQFGFSYATLSCWKFGGVDWDDEAEPEISPGRLRDSWASIEYIKSKSAWQDAVELTSSSLVWADLGQPEKHFEQIRRNLPWCICLSVRMLWKRLEDVQLQERSCVHVMSLMPYGDSGVVAGLSCYLLAADTRLRDRSSPLALDIIGIHHLQVLIPYTIVPDLIAWPNFFWCLSQYSSMKHHRHPRLYMYFVSVIPLWSSTW